MKIHICWYKYDKYAIVTILCYFLLLTNFVSQAHSFSTSPDGDVSSVNSCEYNCFSKVILLRQYKMSGGSWGPPDYLQIVPYEEGEFGKVACDRWSGSEPIKSLDQDLSVETIIYEGCVNERTQKKCELLEVYILPGHDWKIGRETHPPFREYRELFIECFIPKELKK